VTDRCEELVALNQAVIDTITAAYMAKKRLETAMQNNDVNLQAYMAAVYTAQSEERQAVAARDKHKQQHWCGGQLSRAAGF
jgi:glycyl-tRNA synthetase beta subunit